MSVNAADPRDVFLNQVASGRSFLEVGGLWMTVNEKASVARKAGASRVAIADLAPKGHEMWTAFERRIDEMGYDDIDQYGGVNLDTVRVAAVDGPYDVVHCSGVLYHCPNPLHTVRQLAALTSEYLILTSMVVPSRIKSRAGQLELPEGAALLVPALGEEEFAIVDAYWQEHGVSSIVVSEPGQRREKWSLDDYGPWWWLYPPITMRRMMELAGFHVVEEVTWWDGRTHTLLGQLRPVKVQPRCGSYNTDARVGIA